MKTIESYIDIHHKIFYEKRAFRDYKNWTVDNTENIINWVSHANLQILLIDTYLIHLKNILRINTLWSLIISSLTSTISLTQFTIDDVTHPSISLVIKFSIFFTSLFTSLITGYIKIEKIQEIIENLEDKKSLWSDFLFNLLREIQLSLKFRKDAEELIKENIEKFYELNTKQFNIPNKIKKKVSKILIQKNITDFENTHIGNCKKCCNNTFLCCQLYSFKKYNISKTKRKISQYHNNNICMKNELLDVLFIYPDYIESIIIKANSDLFNFQINKTINSNKLSHTKEPYYKRESSFNMNIDNFEDKKYYPKNIDINYEILDDIKQYIINDNNNDYIKIKNNYQKNQELQQNNFTKKVSQVITEKTTQKSHNSYQPSEPSRPSPHSKPVSSEIKSETYSDAKSVLSVSQSSILTKTNDNLALIDFYSKEQDIHPTHEKRTFTLGEIITKHFKRNSQDAFNKLKNNNKKESL
jgi:hypothetical protein